MTDKQTVLIVDDIADNLDIVANILIPKKLDVFIAQNGKNALNIATKVLPDLILLDIMMPEMNGYEVCKKLKEKPETKNIPVIFLSAKDEKESIVYGFEIGAVDYVSKPFFEPELIARVKTHLELKKANYELEKHQKNLENIVAKRTIELEASRNNFKNIFESSSDAIFITDLKGNFKEFNSVTTQRLFLSKEEILSLNQMKFHQLQDNKPIDSYFKNIIQSGKDVFPAYYTNVEGKKIYVELSGTLIKHKNSDAILHVSRDITRRQELEKQKLNIIMQAEEKERQRFAKDLHDGLGATLSAAKMYLGFQPSSEKDSDAVKKAISLIDHALKDIKEIALNISPHDLQQLGLVISLQNFCKKLDSLRTINVKFNARNFNVKIDESVEIQLFRTINELINNTLKYAKAKNINIDLYEKNNKIIVEYSDDGKGFNVHKVYETNKGSGLNNIINRAKLINGEVQIKSEPGNGMNTIITVALE